MKRLARFSFVISFCLTSSIILAQGGIITTIAGTGVGGYNGDNKPATTAQIYYPYGICIDAIGNVYIDEWGNHRIRKVNTAGTITTYCGNGVLGNTGNGGPATAAQVWGAYGMKMDGGGNIYFADAENAVVRKISTTTGIITLVAGKGTTGYAGDGGAATNAELNYPTDVVVDQSGNIYIADMGNNRVRKIDPSTGIITTIAGTGTGGYSGDGGQATAATLAGPYYITVDNSGNIFFTDNQNAAVRKINISTGIITTYAGKGQIGYSGDCGPATNATMSDPLGLAFDNAGNLFISDAENNVIREVYAANQVIITYAGNGTQGYSGNGGPAIKAALYHPVDLTFDNAGDLIFDDDLNMVIREIQPGSQTSAAFTLSGISSNCGICNGSASINFTGPDSSGASYVWSNGQTSQTATNLCSGTYTVTVNEGCVAFTDTVTIHSSSNFIASTNFSQLTNVSCFGGNNGQASVICTGGTPPYTYNWSPSGNAGPSATQLTAGTYTVNVTDSTGCSSTVTINIKQPEPLSISTSLTNANCGVDNGSAKVTVTGGTAPYSYLWLPNLNQTDSLPGLSQGTYTVEITDSNNCKKKDSVIIHTIAPNFTISGNDSICKGNNTILTVQGVTSYAWSTGATSSSINVSPSTTTVYSVLVSKNGQCADTLTDTVRVDSLPTLVVCCDTLIYIGQSIPLLATGGVSYNWQPATGLSCTNCPNPEASPKANTTYTVTINNKNGCSSKDSVMIRTESCAGIYIPNAFSPNGDQVNPTFYPKGDCIFDYTISIYDKWGQLVYHNSDSQPWNGTYNNNGIILEQDTYVYQLTISTYNNIPQTFIGKVTLLK